MEKIKIPKTFLLYEETVEKVKEIAKTENRSLNGQVQHFLELGLEQTKKDE